MAIMHKEKVPSACTTLEHTPMDTLTTRCAIAASFAIKRGIDIVLALFFIVLTFPLFVAVFLLILLLEQRFPIYAQTRVGKLEGKFTLYKFVTMVNGADTMKKRSFPGKKRP